MRHFPIIIAATLVAACAPKPVAAPAHSTGVFDLTFTNGSTTMTGLIVARADSMEVRLAEASCRTPYEEQTPSGRANFTCSSLGEINGLSLSISKSNPEQDSRWSGTVPRRATTRRCLAYGQDEKGKPACVSQEAVAEEFDVSVSGVIRVKYRNPIGVVK